MGRAVGLNTCSMLREIDHGWDFKVLVVDAEWIVRIPAAGRSCDEARHGDQPPAGPRPLRDEDSDGARGFLEALHASDADGLDLPRPDWLAVWRERADEFKRVVSPQLDRDERTRGDALLLEVESLTGFTATLTHCDVEPPHLLVRDGRLAGVIDWAGARIGDPALDGWLLNGPFPGWDVDDDLRRRALVYYRLGPWFVVEYGLRTEQSAWVERGLAELRSRL